ncbi:MAG: GNAT family N-acetyltransferase [bacterium]
MTLQVREALPQDFPFIRELAAVSGLSSVSPLRKRPPEEIQQAIKSALSSLPEIFRAGSPFRLFTAADENNLFLGYLLLQIELDYITGQRQVLVVDFAVSPSFRKHGVGSMLLKKAEEFAGQMGIKAVAALVTTSNEPSLHTFLKQNYVEESTLLLKCLP